MEKSIANNSDCTPINIEDVKSVKEKMLINDDLVSLSELFKLLSNQTRVTILWALSKKELCVCDLAVLLGMSKSAVSHQLRVLRQGDLVKVRKSGTHIYYSIIDNHIISLLQNSNHLINKGGNK